MIKLRNGSAIVIEPKGVGLNIVLKGKMPVASQDATTSKDANNQEKVFTFTLPMSLVPYFYGSLIGKNYFATKNNQQYSLVVMHTGMKRKTQQNKVNETQTKTTTTQTQQTTPSSVASMLPDADDTVTNSTSTTSNTSQNTQNNANTTDAREKQKQKDIELINLLVYEKQEGGKTSPRYVARFVVSKGNIPKIKQEVKKAMKQIDKWSLKTKSLTITKAGPIMILTQNANQLILDYSNKDELKDELTELVMSNREETTINRIKFTKDDAATLLSLLTHMEI